LSSASGRVAERRGFLLELEDDEGRSGFGEALPLPHFGGEDLAACERALRASLPGLPGLWRESPEERPLPPALSQAPVARAACESARLVLDAEQRGLSLAEALVGSSGKAAPTVPISTLVAGEEPDEIARSVRAGLARGIQSFKLKLAVLPFAHDLERVAALRGAAGPSAELRLDANGAWDVRRALGCLEELAQYDIRWIEQPVANARDLARVREGSPIAVAADELVSSVDAAAELLSARAADVLVLKLSPLGGPAAALEVARLAREEGVTTVVTSFLDSSLGIRVALHAASALCTETASGLDTAVLLADDLVSALELRAGHAALGAAAGLGCAPTAAALARLCVPLEECRA
jgi:o-succinylbenzoate synthase